jgi:hypothetical protein
MDDLPLLLKAGSVKMKDIKAHEQEGQTFAVP